MKDEALRLALEALEIAQDNLRPHGDNCFLHDEGEYNRCFCGKDSLSNYLQEVVEKLDTAIKQALAAPVQEPVALADEVIGCFHAAEIEGLTAALANTTDEHLKDLVERRLMYALYAAEETKEKSV